MKPQEISAVIEGIVPVVREFVSHELAPLDEKLKSIDKRIEEEALALVTELAESFSAAFSAD
jgi:hypothetical protein